MKRAAYRSYSGSLLTIEMPTNVKRSRCAQPGPSGNEVGWVDPDESINMNRSGQPNLEAGLAHSGVPEKATHGLAESRN
jgi:hypothetical protein